MAIDSFDTTKFEPWMVKYVFVVVATSISLMVFVVVCVCCPAAGNKKQRDGLDAVENSVGDGGDHKMESPARTVILGKKSTSGKQERKKEISHQPKKLDKHHTTNEVKVEIVDTKAVVPSENGRTGTELKIHKKIESKGAIGNLLTAPVKPKLEWVKAKSEAVKPLEFVRDDDPAYQTFGLDLDDPFTILQMKTQMQTQRRNHTRKPTPIATGKAGKAN